MNQEVIPSKRGTCLRKNGSSNLKMSIESDKIDNILLINHTHFKTRSLKDSDLIVKPHQFYMIINKEKEDIMVKYDINISNHEVIYNPYKFENSVKKVYDPETFKQEHLVPEGYIDILPKWYSIKFSYPNYNLIYLKPELGISIQLHKTRREKWTIVSGKPIVINGNNIFYFVENNVKFQSDIGMYHSIINPNKRPEDMVIIREEWSGNFDEEDIIRVFNPNNYK